MINVIRVMTQNTPIFNLFYGSDSREAAGYSLRECSAHCWIKSLKKVKIAHEKQTCRTKNISYLHSVNLCNIKYLYWSAKQITGSIKFQIENILMCHEYMLSKMCTTLAKEMAFRMLTIEHYACIHKYIIYPFQT